ncbi:transposase [Streptomyces winkii]|uniref:transposase n=1 Tax=Streptomyces winkii TaxID=3051178 RepID=UPI0037DA3FF8
MAPNLLASPGGRLTSATLVGETPGWTASPARQPSPCHAGAAPIPVWSGNNVRVRLNPGGKRQLNAALHFIALTQLRPGIHPPARTLYERLRASGKTRPEALRVLKRRLADVVYRNLHHDQQRKVHMAGASGLQRRKAVLRIRPTSSPHQGRDERSRVGAARRAATPQAPLTGRSDPNSQLVGESATPNQATLSDQYPQLNVGESQGGSVKPWSRPPQPRWRPLCGSPPRAARRPAGPERDGAETGASARRQAGPRGYRSEP